MREKFEQAVKQLQEKAQWLANNGAKQRTIDDYNRIIKTLVDYFNVTEKQMADADTENVNYIAKYNDLLQRFEKRGLMLQICGIDMKGINEVDQMDPTFLEEEAKYRRDQSRFVQSKLEWDDLISQHRVILSLVESDLMAIDTWNSMKEKSHNLPPGIDLQPTLDTIRDSHPEIKQWFGRDKKPAKSDLIKQHCICSNTQT